MIYTVHSQSNISIIRYNSLLVAAFKVFNASPLGFNAEIVSLKRIFVISRELKYHESAFSTNKAATVAMKRENDRE